MTRYQEQLSLFMYGEPTEAELNELAALLKNDEALTEHFREELLIWETWSQENAPERSADAFLAGFRTRFRAEEDAPEFELSVIKHLKERKNPFLWQPIIAIAAVLIILLSLGYFFNPADINTGLVPSAQAGMVQIQGECVCMHCTLAMTDRCSKAVRYIGADGKTRIIRLVRNPDLRQYNACFCKGPTLVKIEGKLVEENGVKLLAASSISIREEKM